MLHNNLSNHSSPVIAFDLDTLLYEEKERKKALGIIKLPPKKVFSNHLFDVLRSVWSHHDVALHLTTGDIKVDVDDLYEKISNEGVAITNIVYFEDYWDDVYHRVANGRYMYFFTANEEMISYIGRGSGKNGTRGAYHISDIRRVL